MGNANASYSNSYSDTYVISAWEKKCDVTLKRREHAAPALAAALLAERKAREVEVEELRAALKALHDGLAWDWRGHPIGDLPTLRGVARQALKGQRDE